MAVRAEALAARTTDRGGQEFTLIHADQALLVVNKPSGLLSVPGRGEDKQDWLITRAQSNYRNALIVHRLDRDTSGLLVLARWKDMHRSLSILFQNRLVEKRYIAIVDELLAKDAGEVNLSLLVDWPNQPLHKVDFENGKPSPTLYRVLNYAATEHSSRIELTPETGRTHHLRVHMQALVHPILGDSLYMPGQRPEKKPNACFCTQSFWLSSIQKVAKSLASCAPPIYRRQIRNALAI